MIDIRHPEITIRLVGTDSNAFNILGLMQRALRDADAPEAEVAEFMAEAAAGTYDELLQACKRWVDVALVTRQRGTLR